MEKEIFKTPNVYKGEASVPRPASLPQSNAGGEILRYHPDVFNGTVAYAVALNAQHSGELLLQESDPMMEKTERKMPNGKPLYKCKVCGKEGEKSNTRHHIERNHMEGVSVPCKFCEKTFSSRMTLSSHISTKHKY